ncbi:hypothetical protein B296_00046511 [Ensete ventricosum]|uniref:Uncharacterized protein n=1 Tax=Ensete ventricosum TaxID=4639 RepID=A0A426YPV4_ENSVE|nr:hypothetical protein B296_00046511 [Ensete ventricosum]
MQLERHATPLRYASTSKTSEARTKAREKRTHEMSVTILAQENRGEARLPLWRVGMGNLGATIYRTHENKAAANAVCHFFFSSFIDVPPRAFLYSSMIHVPTMASTRAPSVCLTKCFKEINLPQRPSPQQHDPHLAYNGPHIIFFHLFDEMLQSHYRCPSPFLR